jgi:hypothetical protein
MLIHHRNAAIHRQGCENPIWREATQTLVKTERDYDFLNIRNDSEMSLANLAVEI